jgi:hypothetical protein
MSDIRGLAKLVGLDFTKRGAQDARMTGDGSLFTAPWYQSLVFAGQVYYANAGSITAGIAGHAAVDADQPEIAVRVMGAQEVLPLHLRAGTESFETTLGIHGVMFAASGIDIGAGTSTLFTGSAGSANGQALNMRFDFPSGSTAQVRHTYSANGTDPLTAGNFMELGRESGNFDSDPATSGIKGLTMALSAFTQPMPVLRDTASLLGYGEGGTAANFYFHVIFFEGSHDDLTR